MGIFSNGNTSVGTLLPQPFNQNAAGNAFYSGGIGIDAGICLCTGLVTDADSQVTGIPDGLGVGVEGPNNAYDLAFSAPTGEMGFDLGTPNDADFSGEVAAGLNVTVLQFKITLNSPGFLRISFVHGSDEHPVYALSTYNDTPLVFVGDENGQDLENIILFKDVSGVEKTLTLSDLDDCNLLLENLVAPNPSSLPSPGDVGLDHADVDTDLHYDHEFAGFTKKLTRETKCVLAGNKTYTIKIVIQDVTDSNIDSATFFETNSLKLFSFLAGDFNLDGKVGDADLSILLSNWGASFPGIGVTDGDGDGSGAVGDGDLSLLLSNWGANGGNINFCADFDRDGDVDDNDFSTWLKNANLDQCASRFEGDADGDGDVDLDDLAIYNLETGGDPSGLCDCSTQMAMAGGGGGGESLTPAASSTPDEVGSEEEAKYFEALAEANGFDVPSETAPADDSDGSSEQAATDPLDLDQDGDIDRDDVLLWQALLTADE